MNSLQKEGSFLSGFWAVVAGMLFLCADMIFVLRSGESAVVYPVIVS